VRIRGWRWVNGEPKGEQVKATSAHAAPVSEAIAPGASVLIGLMGRNIQASRSPAMHEAEGRRQGLNYIYKLIDIDRMGPNPPGLDQLLRFAEHLGYCGLNVTYPFKQEVIAHLDELSGHAAAIGSINTVVLRNGRRVGHNTDAWGFAESFRLNMAGSARDTVLLLGAGGAGGAVAQALVEAGVERLLVNDVDAARARALAERLASQVGAERVAATDDVAAAMALADGVVNATPVGMSVMPRTPIAPELLSPRLWVVDIIYFPMETALLKAARSKGCRIMDGADMAVFQAARAFEHFTGLPADAAKMRATFLAQASDTQRRR